MVWRRHTRQALADLSNTGSGSCGAQEEFFDSFACGRDDGTPFSCKIMLKAVQGVLK